MDSIKYTQRNNFPDMLPVTRTGYCFSCRSILPSDFFSQEGSFSKDYHCADCNKKQMRILLWDPSLEQSFDSPEYLIHESAGVIVLNENNEVLLFYRNKYPVSHTIPAGHVDREEDSKTAASRELKEETGIESDNLHAICIRRLMGDSCSRGADIHEWHLFATKVADTKVVLTDEGQKYGWYKLNDLPKDLTLPTSTFLKDQNILNKLKEL